MVDFHGWEMPLQYSGIIDEHINTRSNVSIFDVSHMGRFETGGSNAFECIQTLVTNDVSKFGDLEAMYSPMCYENGGIVDDLIVYKVNREKFLVVVNASNRNKDIKWISDLCRSAVVENISDNTVLLALQGLFAQKILEEAVNGLNLDSLRPFDVTVARIFGTECMVSRARDTLRLEAGLMLYGNDIEENINPLEVPLK